MRPKRLYAKSAGKTGVKLTLLEHTADVVATGETLIEVTGDAQLRALGLDPTRWGERFRRELLLAALLHDLGKANCYFQRMIEGPVRVAQPIRHEAVSFWISRRPAMREWIKTQAGGSAAVEWVLWAVAGHHRKFPPGPPSGEPMSVFLGHDDFRETLAWGAKRLALSAAPSLENETIQFTPLRKSVAREFEDAQLEDQDLFQAIVRDRPEEARYVALLKASLIAADVSGSIRRRGEATMVEWIGDAFANVPTTADLDGVVTTKLSRITRRDPEKEGFREAVGGRTERVVFVRGGCGCGKTLAAYHWAARTAERLGRGLRLYFCYPTTGTASEGYRDYLKDADLPAALIHGRAEVDMTLLGLGDDEPDGDADSKTAEDEPGRAAVDSAGALEHWSTPLVSCTVDTVLGLMQNNRRGMYLWPSLAGSAVVFDEIHSYDDELFAALLRFLTEVRGVPCLLMTASLPAPRLQRIEGALASIGEKLGQVPGPERHETLERYQQVYVESPWDRVSPDLADGKKVLWVVNTVDEAMALAACPEAQAAGALIYHSRFRYEDRVKRHQAVIEAFRRDGPALAITTQVAEMSLDLSADLLVTQLAPIYALIQRLGRLNRYATKDDPWPFVVYKPSSPAPYEQAELVEAENWLQDLGDGGLSQRSLTKGWMARPEPPAKHDSCCAWLDGGFETRPRPVRKGSPGIEIILQTAEFHDAERVRSKAAHPEEVRIPMPPPKDRNWHLWEEVAFCKVPPPDRVEYHPMRGARWIP